MVKPTKLVALSQNVGFAAANNVGFRHSTADHVVFMNSDIHWRSFAPLEFGLKLLRDDPSVGVVGFELHFEDGALQHGGMELEIAPEFGNLVFCVHAGKGLPGKDMGSEISAREVEAVTGALMMVRRSDFAGAAFDEGYFGGDFEDGDLCLSMRALGKKVMLVECSGLFHLERQSIQNFGAPSLFTVLNCMRFTERWRKFEFESR
jgi:GT2 family glycosyltransferase